MKGTSKKIDQLTDDCIAYLKESSPPFYKILVSSDLFNLRSRIRSANYIVILFAVSLGIKSQIYGILVLSFQISND